MPTNSRVRIKQPRTREGLNLEIQTNKGDEWLTIVESNIAKAKVVKKNGFRMVETGNRWDSDLVNSKKTRADRLKAINDSFEALLRISDSLVNKQV